MLKTKQTDVVIVGAGVAGAALAVALGRQGRSVIVIDKSEKLPEILAGELLQPGGVEAIRALGLTESLQGIEAQEVRGFAVVHQGQGQALPYPALEVSEDGSQAGAAFHHQAFVRNLRQMAHATAGVSILWGSVDDLLWHEGRVTGVLATTREGEEIEIRAGLTVACDGRSSRLRPKLSDAEKPKAISYSVGVLLEKTALPFPDHGHVFLTTPAPTLAYRISDKETRLLFDIPGELPKARGGGMLHYLRDTFGPQLPEGLRPAFFESLYKPDAIKVMQTFQMPPALPRFGGALLIGDAFNMRHPLTGAGMTVALHDVRLLVALLEGKDLHTAANLDPILRAFHKKREKLAVTIDMLAGALYEIFRADDPAQALMREAVLSYWKLGGSAISGPMSLLSGLSQSPSQLLFHFLAVAAVGVAGRISSCLRSHPVAGLRDASRIVWAALRTIHPQIRRGTQALLP